MYIPFTVILKQKALVCQFAPPSDVDQHNKPEVNININIKLIVNMCISCLMLIIIPVVFFVGCGYGGKVLEKETVNSGS